MTTTIDRTKRTMQLTKCWHFESARHLPRLPPTHRCSRMHGSSFQVEVVVECGMHPTLEWGVDFDDLEAQWRKLYDVLDHRLLNDVEGLANPTTENIAFYILERLQLPPGPVPARITQVSVAELPSAKVTVFADR